MLPLLLLSSFCLLITVVQSEHDDGENVRGRRIKQQSCGGFNARYWKEQEDWDYIQQYKKEPVSLPFYETIVDQINFGSKTDFGYPMSGEKKWFGYFKGKVNFETTGNYLFDMKSDDGSWFGIDNQEIINLLSGRGSYSRKSFVTAGEHDVMVFMYELGGAAYLHIDMTDESGKTWMLTGAPCKDNFRFAFIICAVIITSFCFCCLCLIWEPEKMSTFVIGFKNFFTLTNNSTAATHSMVPVGQAGQPSVQAGLPVYELAQRDSVAHAYGEQPVQLDYQAPQEQIQEQFQEQSQEHSQEKVQSVFYPPLQEQRENSLPPINQFNKEPQTQSQDKLI